MFRVQKCQFCGQEYKNVNSLKSHQSKFHRAEKQAEKEHIKINDSTSAIENYPTGKVTSEQKVTSKITESEHIQLSEELSDKELITKAVTEYLKKLQPGDPTAQKIMKLIDDGY